MSSLPSPSPRPLSPGTARVVEEMVVMLGQLDLHEVRVGELARRAGVSIPTVYYHFRSLGDIVAEATVVIVRQFLEPFATRLADMARLTLEGDESGFRVASGHFMDHCWSPATNKEVHRVAPLVAYFRQVAPEDVRLRQQQARALGGLIDVVTAAQHRGWISEHDDATAFAVLHYTCVMGQAVFWHPRFGRLTEIDFSEGVGRLRYQTTLREDIREFPV